MGKDYAPVLKTVEIPAGSSSKAIEITPIDDLKLEGPETVVFSIARKSNYSIQPGQGVATITILDDEKPMVSLKARGPYHREWQEEGISDNLSYWPPHRGSTGRVIIRRHSNTGTGLCGP